MTKDKVCNYSIGLFSGKIRDDVVIDLEYMDKTTVNKTTIFDLLRNHVIHIFKIFLFCCKINKLNNCKIFIL